MAYKETLTDQMVVNKLTRAQYDTALSAGEISDTELYLITDEDTTVTTDTEQTITGAKTFSSQVNATGGVAAGKDRFFTDSKSGIDLNNSDMVRVNAIYTDDLAQMTSEGIRFSRSSAYSASASYDTIVAAGGTLYFKPNDPLEGTALSDCYQVYHTGNLFAATSSSVGLMSASDKSKVDSCGVIWRQW